MGFKAAAGYGFCILPDALTLSQSVVLANRDGEERAVLSDSVLESMLIRKVTSAGRYVESFSFRCSKAPLVGGGHRCPAWPPGSVSAARALPLTLCCAVAFGIG